MSGKKFRVVCYCRVATQSQNDDSPLETQSVYLRRYAKDNGLKVIGEVRAYEKGLTMDRPGWYNVLSLAAGKKADAVLVTELGRVARDPWMVMEALRKLSEQGMMVFASDYSLSCNTSLADKVKQASIAMHQI